VEPCHLYSVGKRPGWESNPAEPPKEALDGFAARGQHQPPLPATRHYIEEKRWIPLR
jgi:hypothetical protein